MSRWPLPRTHLTRVYDRILAAHLREHRQLALVSGPRQVGKTTACRRADPRTRYLSWDDRRLLSRGPKAVVTEVGAAELRAHPVVLVIDEIHKYRRWKTLLKGLYDGYSDRVQVLVTGSSRLDVYRRGGDSLMGRYFLYRMHPLTQRQTKARHAFQVVVERDFVAADPFTRTDPCVVPAATLLSQLP